MSSTGRSPVRRVLDQYDTPAWCTRLILPHVIPPRIQVVIDPCAGVGAILDVCAQEWGLPTAGLEIDPKRATEARRKGHDVTCADFMTTYTLWSHCAAIITNPPYGIAEAILRRCLAETDTVAALLRLSFLEGQGRKDFWQDYPDADVYVLPKRPSFTGHGSDSCAYAWDEVFRCKPCPALSRPAIIVHAVFAGA